MSIQPQRHPRGQERGDPRQRCELYMGSLLLLVIVAILFVLWLVLVTLSTGNVRTKRHIHRGGFHPGGRC